MGALGRFVRRTDGASAAEFAFILPGLLFLIFGIVNLCLVTYAAVSLRSAVETAARYAATTYNATGSQPTLAAVQTAAQNRYMGPYIGATYQFSTSATCGSTGANGYAVTGTGSYRVFYGWDAVVVPLSATACFPISPA